MIKHPPHQAFKDFAIVKILGKTYICPGWQEVPNGTTRSDVQLEEGVTIARAQPSIEEPTGSMTAFNYEVLSSKGDKKYSVTFIRGHWDCDCPARQFRRGDCKHIKSVKADETKYAI